MRSGLSEVVVTAFTSFTFVPNFQKGRVHIGGDILVQLKEATSYVLLTRE